MTAIADRGYRHADRLVSTDWVAAHTSDPNVRIIESNEDTLLYATGHVPGAVHVDWTSDLNDQVRRDNVERDGFAALMARIGVTPDTTVVFYGDKNNWWACYAFWVFQLFGHTKAHVMDGGRLKWQKEGREWSTTPLTYPATNYPAPARNDSRHRILRDDVIAYQKTGGQFVDVRSPEEYAGTRMHMPEYPNEGAIRGGHIPHAKSVPWAKAINPDDGTFRPASELTALYVTQNKLDANKDVVAYCRIGERSSHTWFALTYLLGFEKVRNYDGSWTEWGNMVGVPIEK